MTDPQHDARRRLLVALALQRSRTPRAVDGELRRALDGRHDADDGARRRPDPGPVDDAADER
ncbi:hypothetical protein [Patulibacter sp.]|uniref:hypothetical protein n=1 Tax=Patulibacter sp. TaxID=1912859 RepID=UPI0027292022|nr:hypothetical protein [Patulibacter sp.]MDO9407788.1 hypothetical protein [Patulibacter sp.]